MAKYYNLKKILSKKCQYNMIIGERSNGKTYAVLEYALRRFFDSGEQLAIVRRWQEDIRARRASAMFAAFDVDKINKMSHGKYDCIYFFGGSFYAIKYGEDGKRVYDDSDRLGYVFALSEMEHNKSISYPKITTVFFDEFLTKSVYMQDEFVSFMNTLSTIVRQRTDVKIFLAGNTVNKYCPYFEEMGLSHVKNMEQGSIDVYTYGTSDLKVAVEYCESMKDSKKNNFYFAFNNPRLEMIKGGKWELDIYPHLPKKYLPKDVLFVFFILFDGQTYQAEVVDFGNSNVGIYIHVKTTPIKDNDSDLVYTLDDSERMNYNKNVMQGFNKVTKKIALLFKMNKVFYQNNEVGNAIYNYMMEAN